MLSAERKQMQSGDYTHPQLLLPYFILTLVVDLVQTAELVVIQQLGTETSLQTDAIQRLDRAAFAHIEGEFLQRTGAS